MRNPRRGVRQILDYSEGKERIFPRSPAIIGRQVQNCHPPKSIGVVNDIVRAFKEGTKEVAEFWIQRTNGPFVPIRCFAVRDAEGKYRGVIEFTQQISRPKVLVGRAASPGLVTVSIDIPHRSKYILGTGGEK